MNAIISSSEMDINILKDELSSVPSMEGLELSSFRYQTTLLLWR